VDKNVARFDPKSARKVDITQPIHERTPGGLGLHLITSMLNDVQYTWENGTSTITLIKDLGN
jgi:anti-sigma regulatory factor (Ser/Thr protein kinase)